MARYRKIDPRIWNDEKFRAFSDDGKFVFLFVLTHPAMTALGAMRGTLAGLAAEIGWQVERFRDAIRDAIREGMLDVNEKACFVSARNFLRYNEPEGPNSVSKAWVEALDLIPECHEKRALIARCRSYLDTRSKPFQDAISDGIWDAFSHAMPDAKSDASPIQEQEQEQEQNTFCSEPDKPASEPPVLILPCIGEGPKEFLVVQKDIDEWVESFPGINVRQELLKAKAWLPANPTKRKTHRGMKRFLVGWLCRAQDSARPAVPANGNGHSRIVGKIDRTPPPVKPENMAVLEAARVAGGKQ